ncbi:hypothetical protein HaLaN_12793 [Haematococcus lacustris]|uniref:Uncharacterized protein n=1 Tax=Haematococcus lacustris TaxID=44745 RepID=A0A699Z1H8_HAELA|nr:hypothetical protein HaLaN_12793 [Haematococcus lacustris]
MSSAALQFLPLTVNMVLSNAIGLLLGAALIKLARASLSICLTGTPLLPMLPLPLKPADP